ncbi:secretin N-terminal domain-containing protein [Edaphobacter sp.]|uniref:secretin N-terminal domain-containing protein n=1 Tax=Edaphobacter sp. TaxID=1934404 RepID=UPI002DB8862A|nr:secretin N-terminal domain-containing protein [Edaphobacter sp.]HEU5342244.1 secretin N-terminal domain-containing protein [Edaphobacter sp.]
MNGNKKRIPIKLATGVLALASALVFATLPSRAQEPKAVGSHDNETVQTFHLSNVSNAVEGMEIVTTLRNLVAPSAKIYLVSALNTVVVRSTPDQLALVQKLISDLDRPNKTYRLTYTLTEMDNGKRIGTQHYNMIVVAGQRTTLKQGSRVPIATGQYNPGTSTAQMQMTYVDVGMNFDVTLNEFDNGVKLNSRVEQSSIAEQQVSSATPQDPVIRQTSLEGTAFLTPGKPMILGSLDIPGSTRHMDVAVEMEAVK